MWWHNATHVINKQEIGMGQIKEIKQDKFIHARVDAETHRQFVEKVKPLGGVSAVIKEWINKFINQSN